VQCTFAQVLTSLKEEQRRLAAIRKEITETERANGDIKKALGRTDIKKLREQKEALAAQARRRAAALLQVTHGPLPLSSTPAL
jgi:hypothetical protein